GLPGITRVAGMRGTTGWMRVAALIIVVGIAAALTGCRSGGRESRSKPAPAPASPAEPAVVTFDTPDGFVADDEYMIVVRLYPVFAAQWRRPAEVRGLDVIAVVSYVMDRDVSTATEG